MIKPSFSARHPRKTSLSILPLWTLHPKFLCNTTAIHRSPDFHNAHTQTYTTNAPTANQNKVHHHLFAKEKRTGPCIFPQIQFPLLFKCYICTQKNPMTHMHYRGLESRGIGRNGKRGQIFSYKMKKVWGSNVHQGGYHWLCCIV